jgi:hypothetical protein
MNRLADAGNLAPSTARAPVETLLPLAHGFAAEVYPNLLRPEINQVPFWLPWLWREPAARRWMPATVSDRLTRWLIRLLWLLPLLGGVLALVAVFDVAADSWPESLLGPPEILLFTLILALVLAYPTLLTLFRAVGGVVVGTLAGALLGGLLGVSCGFIAGSLLLAEVTAFVGLVAGALVGGLLGGRYGARRRRLAGWRKQLAVILSVQHGLGPGGPALLLEDDEQCSLHLQRFLAEHQVPYTLPLYDAEGRYLFAASGKVNILARALLGAIGKEHDNELFVLLVDLLELDDALAPLLQAVRVALARHHQVLVVCPWPPGLPIADLAGQDSEPDMGSVRIGILPHEEGGRHTPLMPLLERAARERFHAAYRRVRHAFARLGVPMVCAATEEPVPLILQRLERLRMLGRKR